MMSETETLSQEELLFQIEKTRLIYKRVLLFLFLTVIAYAGFVFLTSSALWVLLVIIPGGLLLLGSYILLTKRFRAKAKDLYLTDLSEGLNLSYDRKGAFEISTLTHHGIIPPYDIAKTEDGFTRTGGDGFPLQFQEVRLRRREYDESSKTTKINQFFKGMLIVVKLRKKLDFQTILLPNKFLRPNMDLGNLPQNQSFQKVNLVSPKFSKTYETFSTDQVEARMVFDPIFMERFLEMGEHLGIKLREETENRRLKNAGFFGRMFQLRRDRNLNWMEISFKDDELLISLQLKSNLFEFDGLFKPVQQKNLDYISAEIQHILGISDILKHNMYLGNMEE